MVTLLDLFQLCLPHGPSQPSSRSMTPRLRIPAARLSSSRTLPCMLNSSSNPRHLSRPSPSRRQSRSARPSTRSRSHSCLALRVAALDLGLLAPLARRRRRRQPHLRTSCQCPTGARPATSVRRRSGSRSTPRQLSSSQASSRSGCRRIFRRSCLSRRSCNHRCRLLCTQSQGRAHCRHPL